MLLYKYCAVLRFQGSRLQQDPIQLCCMTRTLHLLQEEVPRVGQAVGRDPIFRKLECTFGNEAEAHT